MNQNHKHFIDPQQETAALQMLPFKVKNMQKTMSSNNINNININNYMYMVHVYNGSLLQLYFFFYH